MEWNGQEIGRLKALWALDLSAAEIGRQMNISKNAVVGKAHRLDLPPRPSPIRPAGSGTPRATVHRVPKGVPTLPSLVAPAPVAASAGHAEAEKGVATVPEPVVVAKLSRHTCVWPMWGEDQRPTHLYCAEPCETSRTYCPAHVVRAHGRPADGHLKRVVSL